MRCVERNWNKKEKNGNAADAWCSLMWNFSIRESIQLWKKIVLKSRNLWISPERLCLVRLRFVNVFNRVLLISRPEIGHRSRRTTMLSGGKVPLGQFLWWNFLISSRIPQQMISTIQFQIKNCLAGHSRRTTFWQKTRLSIKGIRKNPIKLLMTPSPVDTPTLQPKNIMKRWNRNGSETTCCCLPNLCPSRQKEKSEHVIIAMVKTRTRANKQKKSENGQKLTMNRIAAN